MSSRRPAVRSGGTALSPAIRLSELLAGPEGWTPAPPGAAPVAVAGSAARDVEAPRPGRHRRPEPADQPANAGAPREQAQTAAAALRAAGVRLRSGAHRPAPLPTRLREARWALTGPAVVAVVLVALLMLVITGCWLWRGRSSTVALVGRSSSASPLSAASPWLPPPLPVAVSPTSEVGAPAARTATPTAGSAVATLVVDVVGRVRRPGVVRLPAGARVHEAIAAAGGSGPGAALAAVNLARPVVDGEQIRVPGPGEAAPPVAPATGTTGSTSGTAAAAAPIDLNAATTEQLDALPGVGPVLAARIVAWRTEHGPFARVGDLQDVSGIGDRKSVV